MNNKILSIFISAAVALLAVLGIHMTQEFRFYHLESNWLFLYDWADICSRLKMTGGLALVVSSFLTQFFRIPFVGVVVTALIYLSCGWLFHKVLSRKVSGVALAGISLIPAAFMFLCLENDYYGYHAHIALLINIAALYGFTLMRPTIFRTLCGIAAVILLYQMTGSAALVFTVCAVIWEISERGVNGLVSLTYPVVFVLTAWLLISAGRIDSWEEAFTPFMYYSRPSTYFFPIYAWASFPLLLLAAVILACFKFAPSKGTVYALAGCVVAFFIAGNLYGKVHSRTTYRMIQEQYWAENSDWDRIIKTADRRQPTYLVSYLNLALAHKGMLVQNFMYYNPQSLASIMLPTPNLKLGLTLQSNVYMEWGYLGSAQKATFDGNLVTPGSVHPRLIQSLVKSNLVLGADEVAEKYITLLEKTIFYRKWAESMRRFLNDHDAVRNDPELGRLYASLPETDEYARYDGLVGDLRDIHMANPSDRIIAQFYELYQILEKEESR